MESNIKYIGVGRSGEGLIIATYGNDRNLRDTPRNELQGILMNESDGEWRTRVGSEYGTWFAKGDSNKICYLVLARNGYPDRYATALLDELERMFTNQGTDVLLTCPADAYTKVMGGELRNLAMKYEDLRNIDKLYTVNSQVLEVQNIAQAGIQQVLRNTEAAEVVAAKAQSLEGNARVFQNDSKRLERMMYWRKVKINCILIFVVIAIILYIIIPIIITQSNK
eukprot:CAMPEP_0202946142 /NCGR_PEP_ID=MMETSP1395-20130829/8665_1 /ASSEMBLY_ACC=CAM_ASM_000871 /TAXON_ID=5961 /ORGANISM="Blepharisma japonicum, Strain Stock R1072" /LENGTH=223 /DNA_ID=CAMNT_0049646569 /DNA_START=1 /DNA_END=672 /DNA_ORIENTATION=+